MTWHMWIESAFEHFSVPFTCAFLAKYFTTLPKSTIVGIIVLCIFGVEIYQGLVWGMGDPLVLLDSFMDIVYGLFGMFFAIEIAGDK